MDNIARLGFTRPDDFYEWVWENYQVRGPVMTPDECTGFNKWVKDLDNAQVYRSAIFTHTPKEAVSRKFDADKNRVELLPIEALEEIAKVMTFGAKKYSADNWRNPGFEWRRLIGAAMRHLFAFTRGEDLDPESGLPHLAHLGCCVLFLITHQLQGLGTDDRYKRTP